MEKINLNSNNNLIKENFTPLNEDNIFGIKEEDFDRILLNFSTHISFINFDENKIYKILEDFYQVENELKNYLKTLNLLKNEQIKILNLLTEEMLKQKFKENSNKFCDKIHSEIESAYQDLVKNEIRTKSFENYFNFLDDENNKEDVDYLLIKQTFKEIIDSFIFTFLTKLELKFRTEKIPEFLLHSIKRKIKHRIKIQYNPLIKEHYHKIIDNKKEVKLLKSFFSLYSKNSLNIFDYETLKPINETLFNIFILSNINYFKNDKKAFKVFIENFPKYSKVFNLKKIEKLNEEVMNINFNENYFINQKLEKIKTTFLDSTTEELENMLRVNLDTVNKIIEDNNDRYFFIIFSFSMLLNNIIKVENQNIVLNDNLICNSRERQFLYNVCKSFKNYFGKIDPFTINSYSQSVVINNILKSQCVDMFDSQLNMKEILDIERIEEVFIQNSDSDQIVEEFRNILDLGTFTRKGVVVENNYFKNILKSALEYINNDEKTNLDKFNLIPFDNYSLSTNACICVSGFTSDGTDQEMAWENLTMDLNKFVDFYFLNWPSETMNQFKKEILFQIGNAGLNLLCENYIKLVTDIHHYTRNSNLFLKAKKTSKICGQLLAYIIASKTIFKFQTITLIGFSLGANLIKNCLKQLYKLSKDNPKLENLIQNVVFVAGATTFKNKEKWGNIFNTLVAGRIVNCHGNNDNILKFLFKIATNNDAIGRNDLIVNSDKVENYDFSDLMIDHHEYRKSLQDILMRIKLY